MTRKVGPWSCIASKDIYENPWIKVREDQVINPAGRRGIYGIVQFKNQAVGIIPVDAQGDTYLVGQYRYALDQYSWEIPMGGSPMKEDILLSAKRELKEETGIEAQQWQLIVDGFISNSVTDERGYVFLAQHLSEPGALELDDTEDITVRKLSLEEAIQMAVKGEIVDMLSVTGLLKVAVLRHSNI